MWRRWMDLVRSLGVCADDLKFVEFLHQHKWVDERKLSKKSRRMWVSREVSKDAENRENSLRSLLCERRAELSKRLTKKMWSSCGRKCKTTAYKFIKKGKVDICKWTSIWERENNAQCWEHLPVVSICISCARSTFIETEKTLIHRSDDTFFMNHGLCDL